MALNQPIRHTQLSALNRMLRLGGLKPVVTLDFAGYEDAYFANEALNDVFMKEQAKGWYLFNRVDGQQFPAPNLSQFVIPNCEWAELCRTPPAYNTQPEVQFSPVNGGAVAVSSRDPTRPIDPTQDL